MKKSLLSFLGLALLLTVALPLHAQGGCENSPENPTAILAVVGSAGAFFVSAVIDECTRVVTALGHPPLPAFNAAGQISGLFSQPNSTYGPSLLIDMEDGRPTEGEHTIGDLAERATQAGINAPLLAAARCNLQTYEITRSSSK